VLLNLGTVVSEREKKSPKTSFKRAGVPNECRFEFSTNSLNQSD